MRAVLRKPVVIFAAIAVLLLAGFFAWQRLTAASTGITVYLDRAVGVFPGSEVRILGVKVGEVHTVEPEGSRVRVELSWDADYPVPAGASAIVVPPSLVADRYIQLAPAYTGGEKMTDGAELPPERTIVPLELDEVYAALNKFADALGPNGAGSDGELAELLEAARKNLEGNGAPLGESLDNLAKALSTVSDGRGDLFATIDNLATFTTALAQSDGQVRLFNEQLADVAGQLSEERDELGDALQKLAGALVVVTGFIEDNKETLVTNVDALAELTGVLARQQDALITALDYAPVALSDLQLAYNSSSGTLDTRDNVLGANDPAGFVCNLIAGLLPVEDIPIECLNLAEALAAAGLELPPDLAKLAGGN
ncbi:MCE family protein [Phytomonospora endophytica]|uniref:Virulence factor Mce-like protein n=1 Tax=Phytomonospora endophytica TaxID=714109 RepID=A0A841FVQ5_9ACTN|nr:MCE family protein [Phytomonospora endophytica]MBB6037417.1 virulence factor Mce-like protein [Phytomonospora endophytica]GIG69840.1 ABC transporter substrate-binding protein [Phytomonospora endophytica]